MYLGRDSAYLLPRQCPCSWLSPLESTLGQGTDPSSHPNLLGTACLTLRLEKPHLGHPKAIFCSEGSHNACSCPVQHTQSSTEAPSPGKSMVVSSSGDSSKLRMDCWKVLLQLDCKWL